MKGADRSPPINSNAAGKSGIVSPMNNTTPMTEERNKNRLQPNPTKQNY